MFASFFAGIGSVVGRNLDSGLTDSNNKELNVLYEKYKDKGFEILAFPCNQFTGQEPGSNEEIKVACTMFKAEFTIFDKYIYLIRGAELTRLARDYIKYLFGSTASMRLRRAMDKWERFIEKITRTVDTREDWLERTIVATPTWWHKHRKLASLMRSRDDSMQSRDNYMRSRDDYNDEDY